MSKSECSLVYINATNGLTDICSGVDGENVYAKVTQLMSSSALAGEDRSSARPTDVRIQRTYLEFWTDDGKTHYFEVIYDEDRKKKGLPPNHHVNAMIHAARFTTKNFDTVGRSRNQELKDSYGSNYIVGDVYIVVPARCPLPDLLIFGDNPIEFIMQERTPSTQMKQEYGTEVAGHMLNSRMKKNTPSRFCGTSSQTEEVINNLEWVFVDYRFTTNM